VVLAEEKLKRDKRGRYVCVYGEIKKKLKKKKD
jgi:hypothetical protein